MGQAGREKVLREFTSEAIARRTESIYGRVLGGADGAAEPPPVAAGEDRRGRSSG